jgi:hypothetical protein
MHPVAPTPKINESNYNLGTHNGNIALFAHLGIHDKRMSLTIIFLIAMFSPIATGSQYTI